MFWYKIVLTYVIQRKAKNLVPNKGYLYSNPSWSVKYKRSCEEPAYGGIRVIIVTPFKKYSGFLPCL
jgi:hypothetical protein